MGKVLSFDFMGIGPIILDKSGKWNNGFKKPNPPFNAPKRSIVSLLPPEVALKFDGEDDYVKVEDSSSLHFGSGNFTLSIKFQAREGIHKRAGILDKREAYDQGMWIHWGYGFIVLMLEDTGGNVRSLRARPVKDPETGAPIPKEERNPIVPGATRTVDFVRKGDTLKAYVDGKLSNWRDIPRIGNINNGEPLLLGHNPRRETFWKGLVHKVVFYNKAKK